MWTAPWLQEHFAGFDRIACVHMSGLLLRSHMNAGQDGFRDVGSKQLIDHSGPHDFTECPASSDRSITPSARFLQVHASVQRGNIYILLTVAD